MDEYITKEQAKVAFDGSIRLSAKDWNMIFDGIDAIPAADVRPVVLCRECVHWERYDNTAGCGYCHKVKFEYGADGYVFNPVREPDFYCADGRKSDGT